MPTSIYFAEKGCDFAASKKIVTNAYSQLQIAISPNAVNGSTDTFLVQINNVSGTLLTSVEIETGSSTKEYVATVNLTSINTSIWFFMTCRYYRKGEYHFPGFTLYSIILT